MKTHFLKGERSSAPSKRPFAKEGKEGLARSLGGTN